MTTFSSSDIKTISDTLLTRRDKPVEALSDNEYFLRVWSSIITLILLEPKSVLAVTSLTRNKILSLLTSISKEIEDVCYSIVAVKLDRQVPDNAMKSISSALEGGSLSLEHKKTLLLTAADSLLNSAKKTYKDYSGMRPPPYKGEDEIVESLRSLENNLNILFSYLDGWQHVENRFDFEEVKNQGAKYFNSNLKNNSPEDSHSKVLESLGVKAFLSLLENSVSPFQPYIKSGANSISEYLPKGTEYKTHLVGEPLPPRFVSKCGGPYPIPGNFTGNLTLTYPDNSQEILNLTLPELLNPIVSVRFKLHASTPMLQDTLGDDITMCLWVSTDLPVILEASAGDDFDTIVAKFDTAIKLVDANSGCQPYMGIPESRRVTFYSESLLYLVDSITGIIEIVANGAQIMGFFGGEQCTFLYSVDDIGAVIESQTDKIKVSHAKSAEEYLNYLDIESEMLFGVLQDTLEIEVTIEHGFLIMDVPHPERYSGFVGNVMDTDVRLLYLMDNKFILSDAVTEELFWDITLSIPAFNLEIWIEERLEWEFPNVERVEFDFAFDMSRWLQFPLDAQALYEHIEFSGQNSNMGQGNWRCPLNKLGVERGDIISLNSRGDTIFYEGSPTHAATITTVENSKNVTGNFIDSLVDSSGKQFGDKNLKDKRVKLNKLLLPKIWVKRLASGLNLETNSITFEDSEAIVTSLPLYLFRSAIHEYNTFDKQLSSSGWSRLFSEFSKNGTFSNSLLQGLHSGESGWCNLCTDLLALHNILLPIEDRDIATMDRVAKFIKCSYSNSEGVEIQNRKLSPLRDIYSIIESFNIPRTSEAAKAANSILALLTENLYDRAQEMLLQLDFRTLLAMNVREVRSSRNIDDIGDALRASFPVVEGLPKVMEDIDYGNEREE